MGLEYQLLFEAMRHCIVPMADMEYDTYRATGIIPSHYETVITLLKYGANPNQTSPKLCCCAI